MTPPKKRKYKNKTEQCESGYWGCIEEERDYGRDGVGTVIAHNSACPFYVAPVDPQHAKDVAALTKERHPGVFDGVDNDPLGFAARVGAVDDPMPEDLTEKVLSRVKEEQQKTNHLVQGQLLTVEEHEVIDTLGQLAGQFSGICGDDAMNRGNDMWEAVIHIHALQNMVLAQAAARAFPDSYRLMGEPAVNRVKEESDD